MVCMRPLPTPPLGDSVYTGVSNTPLDAAIAGSPSVAARFRGLAICAGGLHSILPSRTAFPAVLSFVDV
eukprot:261721-Amorphochlora_amoeboformis.AAC.3